MALARAEGVTAGRKLRTDTTVVETNIHYPTDSNLLGDGVRVLIRAMKRIAGIVGQQGARLRDRSRSVKFRVLEIGRIVRTKGGPNRERLQQGYEKLLSVVGRVLGQAKRFSDEIAQGVKRSADVIHQAVLEVASDGEDRRRVRLALARQLHGVPERRRFGGREEFAQAMLNLETRHAQSMRRRR